jgi:hypothetical protein
VAIAASAVVAAAAALEVAAAAGAAAAAPPKGAVFACEPFLTVAFVAGCGEEWH